MTPIGPAPITTQRLAGEASPMSIPCSATASGSTSAPCSNERSGGIGTSIDWWTTTDSA